MNTDQDNGPDQAESLWTARAFGLSICECLFWLGFGLVVGFSFGCTWGAMQ